MSVNTLLSSHTTFRLPVLVIFIFLILMFFAISPGIAEKIPTVLTIKMLPENPALNHGFHVTGQLSASSGEVLGNKRVVLESSEVINGSSGVFSFVAIGDTGKSGIYDFFRPKNTPPEYLRVSFLGNQQYEPVISQVLPARGAGTTSAQRPKGTGSLMVKTDPTGADIYVDSVFMGVTPSVLQALPEGDHVLDVGLAGYQNETMEAYISPEKASSFAISLYPEGLNLARTGISSSLKYEEHSDGILGDPLFALDNAGLSMRTYTNMSNGDNSTKKRAQVTTMVSNDTVGDGYNIMVIMTDH